MILFPAIDILGGRSVRLKKGNYNEVTDYGDPIQRAFKWKDGGAEFLHIVDLDGARKGMPVNTGSVREIVKQTGLKVQLGGGIRSEAAIDAALTETGAERVILGSACLLNPGLIETAVKKYGSEKIVCGIDVQDGFAAINGWEENSRVRADTLALELKNYGVKYIVYTDISRDGLLSGVNAEMCGELMALSGLNIIASGGVADLDDITKLKRLDMYGAILGRAIFEGKFTIAEAMEAERSAKK